MQRSTELRRCESGGGRPGPPSLIVLNGLCGRKATLNLNWGCYTEVKPTWSQVDKIERVVTGVSCTLCKQESEKLSEYFPCQLPAGEARVCPM